MRLVRMFAAGALVVGTVALTAAHPAVADEVRPICFPVEGGTSGATWTDTFGDPRGTRLHTGQDLMSVGGEKMRPILSAVDGTVRDLVYANEKGNRLVIEDDDGWFYVYIHLNNDTPGTDDGMATRDQVFASGLQVGQRVSRCQPVSFMGDSGNAEGTSPHLHFEIRMPGGTESYSWSSATPINPDDSLRASLGMPPADSSGGTTATGKWSPFTSVAELVQRQYLDFYGRSPDSSGSVYWQNRLTSGAETPTSFIGRLLTAPEFENRVAPVARLYWAYFDRIPDTEGLLHWVHETATHGATLGEVSQAFAGSAEFTGTYGSLSDAEFVRLVYQNVLDRQPDTTGEAYWTDRLDRDELSRGQVMIGFSESAEYRAALTSKVRVVLAYVAMLERSPDPGGLDHWSALGVNTLVEGVYASDEYASRITAQRA